LFIVIDGPSGVGKTTITTHVSGLLREHGIPVLATREPTPSPIGKLARMGTHHYQGITLACLVAADRYHHLETEIRPTLAAGTLVLCDRYLPTSLVLQWLDGVPAALLWQLHHYADRPDLTVILTADPTVSRERAATRGNYSRFQGGSVEGGTAELDRYRQVAAELVNAGMPVYLHDVGTQSAVEVASSVAHEILVRIDASNPEARLLG
jgi:dTMP kinase